MARAGADVARTIAAASVSTSAAFAAAMVDGRAVCCRMLERFYCDAGRLPVSTMIRVLVACAAVGSSAALATVPLVQTMIVRS